tara:strand:+ start:64 stop:450 length:387 start_codon:yes stop_codon:yes gene_type:complete
MVCEIAHQEAFEKMCVKKIKKLRKQVEELKAENEAKTKVNMFLASEWKELKTSQSLAETLGYDNKLGNDVAVLEFAKCRSRWEKENKELRMERDNLRDLYHAELEKDHRPLNEVIQIIDTSLRNIVTK